jgi:hypothetical protein
MRQLFIVLISALWLTACGGGGDSGSTPTPAPTPTPQPDPTLTLTQENQSCNVSEECLVFTGQVSKNATAASFTLNGIESAEVEVAGVRTEISSDGTVSFAATTSFTLYVTHSIGETLTLGVTNFTVDGTSYSTDSSVDVEFVVPDANARLDLTSLECGESTCNGTLFADTMIDGVNFTLDDGVILTLETGDGTFAVENGSVSFPATTQADVTFSLAELSIQQVNRLTINTFDSVTVSGNVQEVGETLELSFDRNANVTVAMMIPTIYGGAGVTTDPSHEVKGIKQTVQFGPGIEAHREQVVLESVTYSFSKWNVDTDQFDIVSSGTIGTTSGLTQNEAETLSFYADTTPWVYRVEVSAVLPGGDVLKDSETFVKRDESVRIDTLLFPHNVSPERVDQLHTAYDALEEGVEFSSTLANLYPREYMDENGGINPSTCIYTWELNGMFPSVSTQADVDLKKYCNVNTLFSIADINTEASMMLNISSQQHNDLVEVDYTLPASNIFMDYEAQKGSNVVKWTFHAFANPGSVEMNFVFPTNNTSGINNTVVFDVAN